MYGATTDFNCHVLLPPAVFDAQPKLGASCTVDSDCDAGKYCDDVQAVCLDQVDDQQNCLRDAQCKSGTCK